MKKNYLETKYDEMDYCGVKKKIAPFHFWIWEKLTPAAVRNAVEKFEASMKLLDDDQLLFQTSFFPSRIFFNLLNLKIGLQKSLRKNSSCAFFWYNTCESFITYLKVWMPLKCGNSSTNSILDSSNCTYKLIETWSSHAVSKPSKNNKMIKIIVVKWI